MDLTEIKTLIDGNHGTVVDAMKASTADIGKLAARLAELEKKAGRPNFGAAPAIIGARGGLNLPEVTAEMRAAECKAFRHFLQTNDSSALAELEFKTMTVGSDPDGGYLVLPAMAQTMITKLFDASPIRRIARGETIGAGDSWEEPIDNADIGADWVGEVAARTASTTPTVGMLRVPLQETYSLLTVTQKLIDDATIDIEGWAGGKFADKFARQEGTAFITGNGVKKPMGILTYPTDSTADDVRPWGTIQYTVSGNANTLTADGLINLVYSLRAPYRMGATFVFSSSTARLLRLMKDGSGRFLWGDSLVSGQSATLLGYPVEISEDMDSATAGLFPIAFANWRAAYLVVDRPGFKYLRDPYTSKPNVLLYAYRRVGGGLQNSEAIKLQKVSV